MRVGDGLQHGRFRNQDAYIFYHTKIVECIMSQNARFLSFLDRFVFVFALHLCLVNLFKKKQFKLYNHGKENFYQFTGF